MIICVGGAVLDRKYRAKSSIVMATSNPAEAFRSFGGVGRNMCENLARLGAKPTFVSAVGDDENGRAIVEHLAEAGADTRFVVYLSGSTTAEYVAVLQPDNELALGIADMAIFDQLTPELIKPALAQAKAGDWVLFDCNLPQPTIEWLVQEARSRGSLVACNTVSTIKAVKIAKILHAIDLLFSNGGEARAIAPNATPDNAANAQQLHDAGVGSVVLTLGAEGALIADANGVRAIPAIPANPVDVTGAGDALVAGTLNALHHGAAIDEAVQQGAVLAALTIESPHSVRPDLTAAFLSKALARIAGIKDKRDNA